MASQLAGTVANEEELHATLCAMFEPRVDRHTITQVRMLSAGAGYINQHSPRGGLACSALFVQGMRCWHEA
jgi:hypothetical protein